MDGLISETGWALPAHRILFASDSALLFLSLLVPSWPSIWEEPTCEYSFHGSAYRLYLNRCALNTVESVKSS